MPDQVSTGGPDDISAALADPSPRPVCTTDALIVGDTAVLRLRGELDHATAAEFSAVASAVFDQGARNVVIDCAELVFLDSGGIKALLELERLAHQHSGVLTTRRCSQIVARTLESTALTAVLGVEARPPVP